MHSRFLNYKEAADEAIKRYKEGHKIYISDGQDQTVTVDDAGNILLFSTTTDSHRKEHEEIKRLIRLALSEK